MISKPTLLILSGLSICFVSCNKSNVKPAVLTGKNLILSAVEQEKVVTDNSFNFKLFDNLAASNATTDNLFISPLSVSFAMAMTSNGANGKTLTAIRNTMDFNGFTQDELNSYYNNLITNLPELDPNTTLKIANSIWYKNGFDVLPAFIQTNSTSYNAKIQSLDFGLPSAAGTINNWVSAQTDGKIPTIVNNIPSNEVMYLINALYFKSSWKESFDPKQTEPAPFYLTNGTQVSAQFMSADNDMNTYADNHVTVVEMPYSNSKYSMVIIEPKTGTTLNSVIAGLDSAQWQTWMSGLIANKQPINMPKFTFSYGINLNSALISLGMGVAFSDSADFSLINNQYPLQISDVEHKAFVAVDESGTEAAAATSIGITYSAVVASPPAIVINHPFIFAIRQMSSGLILFTGIVNNPLSSGSN